MIDHSLSFQGLEHVTPMAYTRFLRQMVSSLVRMAENISTWSGCNNVVFFAGKSKANGWQIGKELGEDACKHSVTNNVLMLS